MCVRACVWEHGRTELCFWCFWSYAEALMEKISWCLLQYHYTEMLQKSSLGFCTSFSHMWASNRVTYSNSEQDTNVLHNNCSWDEAAGWKSTRIFLPAARSLGVKRCVCLGRTYTLAHRHGPSLLKVVLVLYFFLNYSKPNHMQSHFYTPSHLLFFGYNVRGFFLNNVSFLCWQCLGLFIWNPLWYNHHFPVFC